MNSRYITWEIIVAGLVLTFLAIYLYGPDKHDTSPWNDGPGAAVQAPEGEDDPPRPPSPPLIEFNFEGLNNLKKLEKLEEIKHLSEFKKQFKKLSTFIDSQKISRMQTELKQQLSKLDSVRLNIELTGDNLRINTTPLAKKRTWTKLNSNTYAYKAPLNSALETLNLSMSSGAINITGTNNESPSFTLQVSGDIENPEKISEKVRIEREHHEHTNTSAIDVTSRNLGGILSNISIGATLHLPRGTNLSAETAGGHIKAQNLSGDIQLETSGGHINLTNLEGDTEVKTGGGHISMKEIKGSIRAKTSGGHISLTHLEGDGKIKTSGGQISASDITGGLLAKTHGGNISASFNRLNGTAELFTSAGNISIHLPANQDARIKLKGQNTTLGNAFKFEGTKEQGQIVGTINGGSKNNTVKASCSYGNVSLKSRDE